MGEPKLLES